MVHRNELPIIDIEKREKGEVFTNYLLIALSVALIYPFTPFNFFGGHEIYPWYVIVLIFIYHKDIEVFLFSIFSVLTSIVLYWLVEINFLERVVVFELIQLGVVFISLYYLNKIPTLYLLRLDRMLINGLKVVVLLMVLQVIFPQYLNYVSDILIFRDLVMAVDHRSGGVKGIAPEPAYMAAVIISIYLYSWWVNTHVKKSAVLLSIAGVLLAGSLSGLLIFSLVMFLSFANRHYFKINTNLMINGLILLIVLIVAINFTGKSLDRFLVYFDILQELIFSGRIEEIFKLGASYGSNRGLTLVQSLTNICCGTIFTGDAYLKPYSLVGVLNNLFSPISWILLAYLLAIKKLTSIRLCSLLLMTFYGPVLMVLLYVGLLPKRRVDRV